MEMACSFANPKNSMTLRPYDSIDLSYGMFTIPSGP